MGSWIRSVARSLSVFLVLVALLILYGHMQFYRDPGSIFFDSKYAFERRYSDYRQRQAQEYLKAHTAEASQSAPQLKGSGTNPSIALKEGDNATICVSFVTVRRKGVQYIEDAIGSALAGLSQKERKNVYIMVFFADTDPSLHPTFHKPWLRAAVVDTVNSYSLDANARTRAQKLEQEADWQAKSIYDYTYALESCYNRGTPYVLMLEGDVLLADSWLIRTVKALQEAEQKVGLTTREWLYLRLFNQERSTGWNSRRIGSNHEHWISLALACAILGMLLTLRRAAPTLRPYLDNATLAVVCIVAIPSLVVFFYQAGKALLLPPRPGLVEQNFGCCSQALLYPREQIPGLVKSLREQETGQYDLMINQYATTEKLSRLSLYPVLAQHMGVESTRDIDATEAQAVWSAAFETLNPEKLMADHVKMVEELE